MATASKKELKIFYSSSHKDQDYRDQLEKHLSNLKRQYDLQTWFDRQIQAGDNWEEILEEKLKKADLILLLISPDFMASNYCYNKEMARALERHNNKEASVIPILLRQVHWKDAPFSHIQVLPSNARPVQSWADRDEAFYNIVIGIESAIQKLLAPQRKQEKKQTFDTLKQDDEIIPLIATLDIDDKKNTDLNDNGKIDLLITEPESNNQKNIYLDDNDIDLKMLERVLASFKDKSALGNSFLAYRSCFAMEIEKEDARTPVERGIVISKILHYVLDDMEDRQLSDIVQYVYFSQNRRTGREIAEKLIMTEDTYRRKRAKAIEMLWQEIQITEFKLRKGLEL